MKTKLNYRWYIAAVIIVFVMLLSCSLLFGNYTARKRKAEASVLLHSYEEMIKSNLQSAFLYSDELAAIAMSSDNRDNFKELAEQITASEECVYAELLDAQTLTHVYPESSEQYQNIGSDFKKLDYSYTLATLTQQLVVEGPIVQDNREVYLMIQPIISTVNNSSTFMGEAVIALDAGYVLDSFQLDTLHENGYDYELWRVHPLDGSKDQIAVSSEQVDFSRAIDAKFMLPTTWNLSIIPKSGWLNSGLQYGLIILSFSITALFALLLLFYLQKRRLKASLRSIDSIDAETGFLNRSCFIQELQKWITKSGEPFSLIYIGIHNYSYFAQIGTCVQTKSFLDHLNACFHQYFKSEYLLARIGESNFVVALKENLNTYELSNLIKGLTIELLWKFELDGERSFLTSDSDICQYPKDGATAEELLNAVIRSYSTHVLSKSPAHDLAEKCDRIIAGDTHVHFGEYADLEMNHLAKALTRYKKKAEQLAYMDSSLNIGNRIKLLRDIDMLISYNPERSFTLSAVDIREFSKFNELFSVKTGDYILRRTSERLQDIFHHNLYRINGDVFLGVILDNTNDDASLQCIIDTMSRKITMDTVDFELQFNIGVCQYPNHGQTSQELLENVQIALGFAKKDENTNICTYNGDLTSVIKEEGHILHLLKKAIEEKTLEVWYQPIYNLDEQKFTKAEALLRLKDENGNYLSAYEVIVIAEKNQIMESVGNYVLETALHTLKKVMQTKTNLKQMHINLSVQQLLSKDYAASVLNTISEAGLEPEQVSLEVTETLLIQSFDRSVEILTTLQSAGVHIIMDDFGSGYSSLNYLSRLPIDTLKIDRTLTSQISTSSKQYALLKAIVQMARVNEIKVVAEGVETEIELNSIMNAGINSIQGYYYSKPLSEEHFLNFHQGD